MSTKHKIIFILLVIAIAGLAYDEKINGRRIISVTGTAHDFAVATSTTAAEAAEPATAPATVTARIKRNETIGVILPLTGVQAAYGQGVKEGLDLAAQGVNDTAKFSIRLNLVYEDTKSDVKNAPAAAKKLIDADHAAALITVLSPTSLAVAPVAESSKTVLLTMASIASKLNSAGAFVFKNDDTAAKMGAGLADAAHARTPSSTAILYGSYNDAIVETEAAFAKRFAELGGAVTGEESFTQETTDFRTMIQKLLAKKPGSLTVLGLQRDCAIAIKQVRDSGFAGPIFGYTCIDDPEVVAAAGSAAEGAIFVSFNGQPSEKFSALVKAKYGHEPLRWTAEAFDGMKLLAIALAKAYDGEHPVSSENLRSVMTHITSFTGEAGRVEFDKEGNASRSLYVKTVKNGKIELVK